MRSSIKLILFVGFVSSLLIIASLFIYGFTEVQKLRDGTAEIVEKNNFKSEQIVTMVTSARERVLDMYGMVSSDDPFIRDDLFMDLNKQAARFINARTAVMNLDLSEDEQNILKEQGELTNIAVPIQNQIVELIQQEQLEEAKNLLNEEGVDAQNRVLSKLGELLELQQIKTRELLEAIDQRFLNSKQLMLVWTIITCVIGAVVAFFVILRVGKIEHSLFEENEKARATLSSISDSIFRIDNEGKIVFFNKKAGEVFNKNLEFRDVTDVLPFINVEVLYSEAMEKKSRLGQFNLTVNNKDMWLEVLQETIRDEQGLVSGKVLVIHDQTEIINAKNRMEEVNANLELIVNERTRSLQDTNEQLKNSLNELAQTQEQLVHAEKMAALGGLVAGISHEVNTPIGISVTSATNIEEKMRILNDSFLSGKLTKAEFEEYMSHTQKGLNILVTNLNRASDLIRSFKQVAVDQSSDECRTIDLKEYVDEVLLSLHPNLKRTAIKVENKVPDGIVFYTNPGAIYQIISNLVMNSIIHAFDNHENPVISIDAETNEKVLLHYSDNGKGVSEDDITKIFNPFFTTRRGQGGSGLGMNVVYNLVTTTLKGIINAKSKLGDGLRIDIEFPIENEVVYE